MGNVKDSTRGLLPVIAFWLALLVVAGFFGWRAHSHKQREKAEVLEKQQTIAGLAARYNAISNWHDRFEVEGIKTTNGYRVSYYTSDIEDALLRTGGRPVLIVGSVFEVRRIADQAYLGIKAFEYPSLSFILRCEPRHAEFVLGQSTANGDLFVAVANVTSVSRPSFEADARINEDGDDKNAEVIVEPGDQYILKGTCLDISYVGDYDWH